MVISQKGRAFRLAVCLALRRVQVTPLAGPLAVVIRVYPPDRRKRDIDNIQKPLLDALEKARAYFDDSQIVLLVTRMYPPVRGGKAVVTIRKKERYETQI